MRDRNYVNITQKYYTMSFKLSIEKEVESDFFVLLGFVFFDF
jgi:hypothetical protein